MTLGECLEKTKKLINYYSVSGERVASGDPVQADYMSRAKSAVDTAQKELAGRCPLLRRVTYTQHTLRPLDALRGMRRLAGKAELSACGAAAFSLLCDGELTAVLEQGNGSEWQELLTVSCAGSGHLETVCGQLESLPPPDVPIRLTLSASDAYIAEAGLYREFPRHEETPVLDMRRFHALPADFGGVRSVTPSHRFPMRGGAAFYTVEEGKIGFPWDFDGAAELLYTVYPRSIGENTGEAVSLDVTEAAAETIPYFVAAMLLMDEDPNLSRLLLNLYGDRVSALDGGNGFTIKNTLFGTKKG